ncbi:MAG: hypothetical protein WDA53_00295 [Bacillota bacterium]
MTNNTTAGQRKIGAITAIVGGLICIFVIPKLAMNAQGVILLNAYKFIAEAGNPAIVAAPKMVTFWYPFWSALSIIAGVILLLLAGPINRGDYWARPFALGMAAIPCISGAALIGPMVKFATDYVMNAVAMMTLGLIPFLMILLLEKASGKQKAISIVVFMALGLTAAWNFANFHGAFRILWSLLMTDPRYMGYSNAIGTPIVIVGVFLALVSIPLLAGRTVKGYWLAVIANALFAVGTGTILTGNYYQAEFYVGTAAGLFTLLLLLSPKIGGTLVDRRPLLSLGSAAKENN